jgi:hypothetical protein
MAGFAVPQMKHIKKANNIVSVQLIEHGTGVKRNVENFEKKFPNCSTSTFPVKTLFLQNLKVQTRR